MVFSFLPLSTCDLASLPRAILLTRFPFIAFMARTVCAVFIAFGSAITSAATSSGRQLAQKGDRASSQ